MSGSERDSIQNVVTATEQSAPSSELSIEDQQAAADKAIDAFAAQADVWADEIDLVVIIKNLGAAIRGLTDRMPKDIREGFINRQEAQIDALVRQAYLEGFYRGGESRKAYDDAENASVVEDNELLNASFDLQWEADMRAVKLWRAAHPGNDLVLPDRCCLVTWLMERYEAQLIAPAVAETRRDRALAAESSLAEMQAERDRLNSELDTANNNHRSMAHQLAETGIRLQHAESSLHRVRGETIEECAKVAESVGCSFDNEWNQKLGVAHDLMDVAVDVADTIRSLNITGLDTGAVKTGVAG